MPETLENYSKLDKFYLAIKANRWYWYFSILCRVLLAYAFIVAGMVKILDERFASGLSAIHPMGAYLEALHHTGYYYTFIGIAQVAAAILLLIPRTVTLGALIYFPIILNICILSFAVRFEGSFITAPLMVLANVYLLAWNYDRLRFLLPFRKFPHYGIVQRPEKYNYRFPWPFFLGVAIIFVSTVLIFRFGFEIMPKNSFQDCEKQFIHTPNEVIGRDFCTCVHKEGQPLEECIEQFERAKGGQQ